jgi:hypothetical protein
LPAGDEDPNGKQHEQHQQIFFASPGASGISTQLRCGVAPFSPLRGMQREFEDSMEILEKCSYCGNLKPPVGIKPIERLQNQHRIELRSPICGRCFQEIKKKRIPAIATCSEIDLVAKAYLVKNAANSISKKTPLHKLQDLCGELDLITAAHQKAVSDFDMKAREAAEAAKKVEWLRCTIDETKFVISSKMQSSYEFCRKVANKCCADLETRNAVFLRDKFVCVLCGKDENLSIDHIKPVKLGGTNDLDNLQTLCLPCNLKKGWRYDGKKLRQKSRGLLMAADFSF